MNAPSPPPRKLLEPGDAAPWLRAQALGGLPNYVFDTAAGRPMLLLFFGTASRPESAAAIAEVQANRALFDDRNACFFGVSCDPSDAADGRIVQQIPGIRFFLDYGRDVSRLFGAWGEADDAYLPHWLLLDRTLRVVARFPIGAGSAAIAALESAAAAPQGPDWAPVLMVPGVFEPPLCRHLIDLYERDGGFESGFMREVDGKTVLVADPGHKQRRDCDIEDGALQSQLILRIRRLLPEIKKAFDFRVTRIERYIVACYDSHSGGFFKAHRDNTTTGTAHRRFAVTINLNSEDYEGGDLRFPEFGDRTYRAPSGGAVVFSCSLLHEATPVTRGTRYAFLPFLYDDEAAKIREANNNFLGEGVSAYKV